MHDTLTDKPGKNLTNAVEEDKTDNIEEEEDETEEVVEGKMSRYQKSKLPGLFLGRTQENIYVVCVII